MWVLDIHGVMICSRSKPQSPLRYALNHPFSLSFVQISYQSIEYKVIEVT